MAYQRSLSRVARAFGDETTDSYFVDGDSGDASVISSGDPRTDYVAWTNAVKTYGGTVTVTPHLRSETAVDPLSGQTYGGGALTAARYPVAFVFPYAPATTLNPLFKKQPDDWSDDGRYVYYVAPDSVRQYTDANPGSGMTAAVSTPSETPPGNPLWYTEILTILGGAKWIVIGGIALFVISYLPRGRRE